jgi:purine nucleoside phosphorylase
MRCLGLSTITNAAAGTTSELLSHAEVMDVANRVGEQLSGIVVGVLKTLKS